MQTITQSKIECFKTELSCSLSKLAGSYTDKLFVGSSKADKLRNDVIYVHNVIKVLCMIDLVETDEEGVFEDKCISNTSINNLVDSAFKLMNCNCNCN